MPQLTLADSIRQERGLQIVSDAALTTLQGDAVRRGQHEAESWYSAQLMGLAGKSDTLPIGLQGGREAPLPPPRYTLESSALSRLPEDEKKVHLEQLALITGGFLNPSSRTAIRRTQTRSILHMIQDAATLRYHTDPLAKSIANNIVNYTIGSGIKVDTANDKVDQVLQDFMIENKFMEFARDIALMCELEGEYFLLYEQDTGKRGRGRSTGDTVITRVPPRSIPDDGIEFHPRTIERRLAYKVEYFDTQNKQHSEWYPDITYFEQLKKFYGVKSQNIPGKRSSEFIQMIKVGTKDDPYGRSPFECLLTNLQYATDWLYDRIIMNHERAKVLWIKKVEGTDNNPQMNPMNSPKGGLMLIEPKGITYRIEHSKLAADDAKEDGLNILYRIAAGCQVPIHIIEQRFDEQNYASIRRAGTPFGNSIIAYQAFLKAAFDDIFRTVIRAKMQTGALPPTIQVKKYSPHKIETLGALLSQRLQEGMPVETFLQSDDFKAIVKDIPEETIATDKVKINQIFPTVEDEDPLKLAQMLETHLRMGIVSKDTVSSAAGYDSRTELMKIQQEQAMQQISEEDSSDEQTGENSDGSERQDNEDESTGDESSGSRGANGKGASRQRSAKR